MDEVSRHSNVLLQRAHSFLQDGHLVDVTVVCGDISLPAHRLVLAAYSSYFKMILLNDSSKLPAETSVINLDSMNFDPEVVMFLLDYLYTGTLLTQNINVTEVLRTAQCLQIDRAVNILTNIKPNSDCQQNKHEAIKKESLPDGNRFDSQSTLSEASPRKSLRKGQPVHYVNFSHGSSEKQNVSNIREEKYQEYDSEHIYKDSDVDQDDLEYASKKDEVDVEHHVGTHENCTRNKDMDTSENEDVSITLSGSSLHPMRNKEGVYSCPYCEYNHATLARFRIHYRRHTGEKPYICSVCQKCFVDKKYLKEHMRCHSGERPYVCEICDQRFKASKHLNRHIKSHLGDKPHKCEKCSSTFTNRKNLDRHVDCIHKKLRPFKCEFDSCSYAAGDPSTLRKHLEIHKEREEILCDMCGKTFVGRKSHKAHMLIHVGEQLHCKLCPFKTKYRSILASHMNRIHSVDMGGKRVERTYKCDTCDYSGFTQYEFNMHKQKHSADRPHKCPICNFGSVDKGTLTKHLRTHTGETPFHCEICNKTFTQQSGLARHKRIHLGVKPYKCSICGKLYADKKSLDTHMFKHDNIKPFICHICSYGCVRKDVLLKHIAKVHGEGSVPELLVPKKSVNSKQDNSVMSNVCTPAAHKQLVAGGECLQNTSESHPCISPECVGYSSRAKLILQDVMDMSSTDQRPHTIMPSGMSDSESSGDNISLDMCSRPRLVTPANTIYYNMYQSTLDSQAYVKL